jgi:hypothetical protein
VLELATFGFKDACGSPNPRSQPAGAHSLDSGHLSGFVDVCNIDCKSHSERMHAFDSWEPHRTVEGIDPK